MRFEGKSVVVTGAGSGFGEAIASGFAREGARVVVADVNEENGRRVASAIGSGARFTRTDVSRAADVKAMIDTAVSAFGGLDVLVNNAGFSHRMMPLWELPEEEYERVFATNVRGVYLGCKFAVPIMKARGGGVIVNTASIGAVAPRPGVTAYNATKGAVVTLTRGLAIEVAPFKIRVNAVNPVAAETGFVKTAVGVDRFPDEVRKQVVSTIPLGRLTEPRDVAAAVLFLASPEAEFLTGVCLPVDGGRSIG
ncbi:MAG TPA: glucose 1-dehydrogenase [Candidatus Binatia bacterium]|nr:glucose 1-dehydrogenase [Candidatus Binatia bacterium]